MLFLRVTVSDDRYVYACDASGDYAIDALPFYLCIYLPEWLGGIGIAALLLSSLGSISGLALGIGTMISRDIFNDLLGLRDVKDYCGLVDFQCWQLHLAQ